MDFNRPKYAPAFKVRYQIAILAILSPIICYISRQNLSLAIVSIVSEPTQEIPSNELNNSRPIEESKIDVCPATVITGADGKEIVVPRVQTYGPRYEWSSFEQNLVFQTFFFTYVIFQIPATRLSETLGAKWILFVAGAGSSILSFISPWAIGTNVYLYSLVRAIMGLCQTAVYPACYVLFNKWLPPMERSQALPILSCGAFIGAMITSTATGFFSVNPSFGWEYSFYMPGLVCALWSILWILIGASEPRDHKGLSIEELDYIEAKLEARKSTSIASKQISWKKVLKSQHVWAFTIVFFSSNWAFTVVLLQIPTYLNDIILIPPSENGIINSIIYLLFCVTSPIIGSVSTLMIETRPFGLTHNQTRKFFESIGVFSQALAFIALTFIGCDTTQVLTILYLQIVLYSFVNGGEVQIPSDISTDFAGTIYAIGNCVGSSAGFIVPYIRGAMVPDRNRGEWNIYFYSVSAVTALGGIYFLIFGKNDPQDFSMDNSEDLTVSQGDICSSTKTASFRLETRPGSQSVTLEIPMTKKRKFGLESSGTNLKRFA